MAEDLMEAVHEAVVEHGYKDLSISKIAENYSKGKSNIYHHYDRKEDLMLSFLDHLKNCMEKEICMKNGSPEEELDEMLEKMLGIGRENWEFRKAVLEMKSEAPFNDRFSEKITEIDNRMIEKLAKKLEELDARNAEEKAELMLSAVEGTVDRKLTRQEREGLEEQKEKIKKIKDIQL